MGDENRGYDLSTETVTETHIFEHSILARQAAFWYCQNNVTKPVAIGLDGASMFFAVTGAGLLVTGGTSLLAVGNANLGLMCKGLSEETYKEAGKTPSTYTTTLGAIPIPGFKGRLISFGMSLTDALLTVHDK